MNCFAKSSIYPPRLYRMDSFECLLINGNYLIFFWDFFYCILGLLKILINVSQFYETLLTGMASIFIKYKSRTRIALTRLILKINLKKVFIKTFFILILIWKQFWTKNWNFDIFMRIYLKYLHRLCKELFFLNRIFLARKLLLHSWLWGLFVWASYLDLY